MAKTATTSKDLRKGDKVVATTDLRGVPEGTSGKVIIVDGLTWIRYWVRFDNGTSIGSVPRAKLATPDQWRRRHDVVEDTNGPGDAAAADDGGGAADDDGAGGGGKATPSGTMVPQKLIDRSAAARTRLAA